MQALPEFLDPPHEVEDLAHLGDGERHRRLVEHDQVGVVVHRPADRDALPLAAREVGDRRVDADSDAAEADRLLQDPVGDRLLLADVDEAPAVGDLPPDEEVAPERLLLGERLVLVDGLDRQVVRHPDRVVGKVELAVAHEDPPRGRRQHPGQHLDQRRLAGTVVADQPDDLVLPHREVDVPQRLDRAEELLHPFEAHDVPEVRRRGPLGQARVRQPRILPFALGLRRPPAFVPHSATKIQPAVGASRRGPMVSIR